MTIAEALNLGLQHEQAGRFAEAAAIYRHILSQQPDIPQVHNNLANTLAALGQLQPAIAHFRRAMDLQPDYPDPPYNLANIYRAIGDVPQAIQLYRRALSLRPHWPEAQNNLGVAYQQSGQLDHAIACFQQAPDYAPAMQNLGGLLCQANRFADAAATYRTALALQPNSQGAQVNLANSLRKLHRFDEAIVEYEKALALSPASPQILTSIAQTLSENHQHAQSITRSRAALALAPNHADAHDALGTALAATGDLEAAVKSHEAAILLQPSSAIFENNLAVVLHDLGRFSQAIAHHHRALQLSPDFALAHLNLGLIYLTQGDWSQGWPEYEWRLRTERYASSAPLTQPRWTGGDLSGRTILIHADQGLGDVIHFSRYLPLVAERGGKIILSCQRELHPLLRQIAQIQTFIAPGQTPPSHDVQCPLMSLPLLFKTTLATIPPPIPLSADPALSDQWRSRIPSDARRKVGLVWAGKRDPDPFRSAPLSAFAPLAGIPGILFCSLQTGRAADDVPPPDLNLLSCAGELRDFAHTAAFVANLDLVITIDTAVAHLAATMGKPTWVLLKKIPDWRWMLERRDSPWYPGIQLFRQVRPNDWSTPIEQITAALQAE